MNSNARPLHCRLQILKGQHILDLVRQHFCVSHATPEQHGSDAAGGDDGGCVGVGGADGVWLHHAR
jgi:hypothetical protein